MFSIIDATHSFASNDLLVFSMVLNVACVKQYNPYNPFITKLSIPVLYLLQNPALHCSHHFITVSHAFFEVAFPCINCFILKAFCSAFSVNIIATIHYFMLAFHHYKCTALIIGCFYS